MKNMIRTIIIAFFFLFVFNAKAQKNITISEYLALNSEPLKVKMGGQSFGKIWKFKFGDYAVEKSKLGWTKTNSKSNLLNTRTESKTTQKFSFSLSNKTTDTALVNAAINIESKALSDFELFPNFFVGENELKLESNNFTAVITINEDTASTWLLLMNTAAGTEASENNTAILTNGIRMISIQPVTSGQNGGDTRAFPALGYEFYENGKSVCALQYYGGGMMGMNKNIIWINKNLDSKMKLTLAAAVTALLQIQSG